MKKAKVGDEAVKDEFVTAARAVSRLKRSGFKLRIGVKRIDEQLTILGLTTKTVHMTGFDVYAAHEFFSKEGRHMAINGYDS